ncbi:MAG: Hint domain-containing protein [Rhodobacteraceae bacterium]|nr:Hint domain-containing protein [Paracoccaceae bacterium]
MRILALAAISNAVAGQTGALNGPLSRTVRHRSMSRPEAARLPNVNKLTEPAYWVYLSAIGKHIAGGMQMPTALYEASHYMIFGPTTRLDNEVDTSFYVTDGSASVDLNETTFWFNLPDFYLRGTTVIDGEVWPVIDRYDSPGGSYFYVLSTRDLSAHAPATASGVTITAQGFTICFAADTLIATPDGEVLVTELGIGDRVLTADGRNVAVKWIGRQDVHVLFRPPDRLLPVRIAAGALGDGLPHSDLTVTNDHALLVDNVLCHAGALVNGSSIRQVPHTELEQIYTVYHVETECHEIILANGVPAETFIDNVSRRVFDNFAEFDALYGDVPEMEELPYPRAMSARQVPAAIRARLAGRRAA